MKLGIDFGTCYSSAALLIEDIPTPINAPLTPGYSLPSSIFITEQDEILVGQAAENSRQKKPQRYRREFKRDLGSPDPYNLGDVFMLPEELVTEVLKKLKIEAEKVALARGVRSLTEVLITVPATYSSYKRGLMEKAGAKAGFSHVQLLEEPVAAAIYYSNQTQIDDGDIILVYDLGGGTFDAALIQKQGNKYQILAMPKGLSDCGGTDFDRLIYQQLIGSCSMELKQQIEVKDAWLARAIVGDLCRDLKHQLSEQLAASIYIPIGLGKVETFELTRDRFERMISPLINETLDCCDLLVRSAGKEYGQINRMLLVGGSSRIPAVRSAIEQRFNMSPFLVDKPELAVCLGAAINSNTNDLPAPTPIGLVGEIIQPQIDLVDPLPQQLETAAPSLNQQHPTAPNVKKSGRSGMTISFPKQWNMSWQGHDIIVKNWWDLIGNTYAELSIDGNIVEPGENQPVTTRDLFGSISIDGKVHFIRAHIGSINFGFGTGCQIFIDDKLVGGDINSKFSS